MLSALSSIGLHDGATAIQQSAIRAALSASPAAHSPTAVLLASRTGTGKTLAALIPALERAMAAERETQTDTDTDTEHSSQPALSHSPSAAPSLPLSLSLSSPSPTPTPTSPLPPPLLSPATLFTVPPSSSRSARSSSPLLCRPLSVLLVPSRELVDQHYRTGKQLSHHLPVRVERLVAGRAPAKERRDLSSAATLTTPHTRATTATDTTQQPRKQHEVSLLVSTPGRLLSYIERGLISLSQLQTMVIDEADVLLAAASEGGFRDECSRIIKLANTAATTSSSSLLFLLLAASVPHSLRTPLPSLFPRVVNLSSPQLHTLPPSVRLSFVRVQHSKDKLNRLTSLVRDIVTSHTQPRVLLFCNSLGSCRAVLAALTLHFQQHPLTQHSSSHHHMNIQQTVLAHHGDLPSPLRTSNLRAFRSGECGVLVVTDLLSRGLDLPELTHVLQFDMSLNPIDFMHRVGRLARQPFSTSPQQQRQQHAISLVCKGDEVLAGAITAQFHASSSIAELSSDKRHYQKL